MAKTPATLLLLAAFCGCWFAVKCETVPELRLDVSSALTEDDTRHIGRKLEGDKKVQMANFTENLQSGVLQNSEFLPKASSFKARIHARSDPPLNTRHRHSKVILPDESKIVRKPVDDSGKFHLTGPGARRNKRDNKGPPPETLDLRESGYVRDEVRHQGLCGCCWAFTAAAVLEGMIFGLTTKLEDVSVENLIDCSDASYNNFGCEGGFPDRAWEWVKANGGIMRSSEYPYAQAENNVTNMQSCSYDKTRAIQFPVVEINHLPKGDEEEIKKALWLVGPIAVSVNADDIDFQNWKYSGIYYNATCSTNVNHGLLLVGYGLDYWLAKNSWGKDWGDNGYIRMSRRDGSQCGIADYAQYPQLQ